MTDPGQPGLELVKDYGWLTILAKPLYWLLEKIHGYVANWGWAIVLLVVLIFLMLSTTYSKFSGQTMEHPTTNEAAFGGRGIT